MPSFVAKLNKFSIILVFLAAVGIVISHVHAAQLKPPVSLDPLAPQFSQLVAPGEKLLTIAAGFGFTEGPVRDPGDFLWVSDETINTIYKVQLGRVEGEPHRSR